jgi:replicative DNA helicase
MTSTNGSQCEVYADPSLELSCLITGLLKQAVLPEVIELGEECFYNEKHRLIFQTMKELYNAGEEVDITSLRTSLSGKGQLEKIGGDPFLATLLQGFTTVNHRYVLKALQKLSGRRKLQMLSMRMREMKLRLSRHRSYHSRD